MRQKQRDEKIFDSLLQIKQNITDGRTKKFRADIKHRPSVWHKHLVLSNKKHLPKQVFASQMTKALYFFRNSTWFVDGWNHFSYFSKEKDGQSSATKGIKSFIGLPQELDQY